MRISEGSAIRASAILFISFYFISGRITPEGVGVGGGGGGRGDK